MDRMYHKSRSGAGIVVVGVALAFSFGAVLRGVDPPAMLLGQASGSALLSEVEAVSTFTVTNTSDSGAGSLRQAIINANGNAGVDIVAFNIPGSGVRTITL